MTLIFSNVIDQILTNETLPDSLIQLYGWVNIEKKKILNINFSCIFIKEDFNRQKAYMYYNKLT